jgi:hypothetical protein
MARTILATIPPPVALSSNKKALEQGFSDGRYWARTSAPRLSIWSGRSRQFAQVRSDRIVESNPISDRTPERTRTLILAILATRDAAREMAIAARVLKDELRIDQCAPVACALFEALLGHGRGLSPGE